MSSYQEFVDQYSDKILNLKIEFGKIEKLFDFMINETRQQRKVGLLDEVLGYKPLLSKWNYGVRFDLIDRSAKLRLKDCVVDEIFKTLRQYIRMYRYYTKKWYRPDVLLRGSNIKELIFHPRDHEGQMIEWKLNHALEKLYNKKMTVMRYLSCYIDCRDDLNK